MGERRSAIAKVKAACWKEEEVNRYRRIVTIANNVRVMCVCVLSTLLVRLQCFLSCRNSSEKQPRLVWCIPFCDSGLLDGGEHFEFWLVLR